MDNSTPCKNFKTCGEQWCDLGYSNCAKYEPEQGNKRLFATIKSPPFEIGSEDFGAILTCAVRYAAGRATYMPGLVRNFIKPLIPGLSNNTLFVLARDISDHKDADAREATEWDKLLSAIEQEQYDRGNRVSDR